MSKSTATYLHFALGLLVTFFCGASILPAQSHWVHFGAGGKLVYAHSPKGDVIPDFSYAGYEGGGVALPRVPAKLTVAPTGADDTAAIQNAIDRVSALPLAGGFRGAIELAPGTFHCSQTISMTASGVVLRGAGNGEHGTTIVMTGEPHLALRIAGQLQQKDAGTASIITDNYVPFGTATIHVAEAANLRAGDTLLILKPVTQSWVHFMGMDDMHRDGKPEHWVSASNLEVRRRIAAVSGKTVTLEVPLMDDYDSRFFEGGHVEVRKVELTGQISQVGVEDLRFVAPQRVIALGDRAFSGDHAGRRAGAGGGTELPLSWRWAYCAAPALVDGPAYRFHSSARRWHRPDEPGRNGQRPRLAHWMVAGVELDCKIVCDEYAAGIDDLVNRQSRRADRSAISGV